MRRLLTILFLLAALGAHAQKHIRYGTPTTIDSFDLQMWTLQFQAPSTFRINPFFDSTNSVALIGGVWYWHDGAEWLTVAAPSAFTLTTDGTSGPATFSEGVLNIPQYAGTTYSAGTWMAFSGSVINFDSAGHVSLNFISPDNRHVPTTAAVNTELGKYVRKADSGTVYVTPYDFDTRLNLKLNSADTASLSNRINLKLNSADTASLSNRINLKLGGADTASISARINLKLNSSDTASLSNRINLKLNSTDTASLSNRINLKMGYADTVSLSARINLKLNSADTSSLSNRLNLKLNSSDTASLSNRINLKLNSSDTASLSTRINLKLNMSDTASLSNRITLRQPYSDTSTSDATRFWVEQGTTSLRNKSWVQRVVTATSYTTSVTINADITDYFEITAQSGALLFNTPSGTPTSAQLLEIYIKDNGTPSTLTFSAGFAWSPPSVTIASKGMVMIFQYIPAVGKWCYMGKRDEP